MLRDGKPVAETRTTTFDASIPGEYQVIGVSGDGVQSFASEPRSNRPRIVAQMPGEVAEAVSAEISYQPKAPVRGFRGAGFRELDRSSAPVNIPVKVDADGTYALYFRYANGNGPVNTENKCAIRTVTVDGNRVGIIVMPQRGTANWNDWGFSNVLQLPLTAGEHTVSIEFRPENNNMNINTNHALVDELVLEKL